MLKLVVIQPGQPDQETIVQGHVANVGRNASNDVVIDDGHVSGRHLRILDGTVAVDLGSSNGTFIEGKRVTEAVLLKGRTLTLSPTGVEVRVEAEGEEDDYERTLRAPASAGGAELENLRGGYELLENEVARLKKELAEAHLMAAPVDASDASAIENEKLRSEYVLLEGEVARLKKELVEAREIGDSEALVARLHGENESLRERLESLKQDLEAREEDDGGSVQARLAMQRVESVQELNEKLQQEVDRLRAELAERPDVAPPAEDASEVEVELQRTRGQVMKLREALGRAEEAAKLHHDQTALVRKLRQELEAAQSGGGVSGGSDLEHALEASRQEVIELRARAAELEGRLEQAAPPEGANVSDLFFKLQSENAELRRKLAAAGGDAGGDAGGEPKRDTKHIKELMEARLRIAALEAEVSNLKVTRTKSDILTAPKPKGTAAPVVPAESSGFDALRVLGVIVNDDIEGLARPMGGPLDEFVVIESLRLVRHVERVVTRVAGDLIQLFQLQTMLPDTVGTFRGIVGDLLKDSTNDVARERLIEYLETLGRWLVVSVGAYRKGAVEFAEGMKADLCEQGLTAGEPLPAFARVPMLAGNELWRRAQDYLKALSPDAIDERVDEFARRQAKRILNEASSGGGGGGGGDGKRPRVDAWKRSC